MSEPQQNPDPNREALFGSAAGNLVRVIHELQMPVVALRGTLDFASHELKEKGIALSEDWLGDAWRWTDLMVRLLQNAQIVAASQLGKSTVRFTKLLFLPDVIRPALNAASVLFQERQSSPTAVNLHNLESIPPLYADKNLLSQAVFNLVSNSLKYGGNDPRIEITAEETREGGWSIKFQDWGIGVPTDDVPQIFSAGYRGRNASSQNVAGTGIGLFVAREIMGRHSATVELTNPRAPTEFTLSLPARLFKPPDTPTRNEASAPN